MLIKIGLFAVIIISSFAVGYLHRRNKMLREKYDNIAECFGDVNSIINSIRYGNLSVRADAKSQEELAKLADSINRMIEALNDREKMIREYQAELTKKNNFLSALLNSLSEGMIVFNEKLVIINANKHIKNWLKNPKIIGSKLSDFISVAEDKTYTELSEDEVFLKGQKYRFYAATTKKLETKDHSDMYMIVISDCTNQKEVESLKEDFVATLTHDLKVPIIAEANMLDFLLNGKFGELSDNQRETLNTMQESNKELLELVQTVLDTYKVKDGEIYLNLEKISVKKFVTEIADEMLPIARKNGNKIVLNIKTDFDLNVDYLQFKRVLKNIVSNAIVHGRPKTDIEITTKQKGEYFYIYVKDHGMGIAKEDIDRVFNKYYSAHRKFRKIGTGLGLYLSRKLVQAHGGELSVTSKLGEWSEVLIKLPHTSA